MTLADFDNRRRALCDLDCTFLVEAAAGTGKTSLMAGRVAMLLSEGHAPSSIAAITFTELAAGELDRKIRTTVAALAAGGVPPALTGILPPEGLPRGRKAALESAAHRLDELTATTIHGFCQAIIAAHGIEAGLDPGARVIDENVATGMFDQALSDFLSSRLCAADDPADPIGVLAKDDPLGIVKRLRELAMLKREHRDATAPAPEPGGRPDLVLAQAVADFARWHASSPGDRATADAIAELETLSASFAGSCEEALNFEELWAFTQPDRISLMRKSSLELKSSINGASWAASFQNGHGEWLKHEAAVHLSAVDTAYRTLLGHIAQRLVSILSGVLSEVIVRYTAMKRDAAVLDFDDLLHFASMLVGREDIRQALSTRFRHMLVDEFQDTDRLQANIVFRLASTGPARRWQDGALRPGALFLVGDPKQAIYGFRGADIEAYHEAREVIARQQGGAVLRITSNFRSRKGIVEHVNLAFRAPFSQAGQPAYVAIEPTSGDGDLVLPHAAKLTVAPDGQVKAAELREAEAAAVASLCRRLIGNVMVRREDETLSPLKAGDIALLAPGYTDLWRYERALVAEGFAVASQAGKSFFARQETQDLLALCRVLSDARDTVAFGALMRGPLVGLADEDLLDIAASLGADEDGVRFTVMTDPALVEDTEVRAVLEALQDLRRLRGRLTPSQLIATAIERLQVRVIVAARHGSRSAPALANIDALIERARPYAVSGMRRFVRNLDRDWREKLPTAEGRVDSSEDAIDLVTMHSAKGLEWPLVIPVNSSTQFPPADQFVHRRSDDTLHWMIGGIAPPELAAARETERQRTARERERLWYVSCTRARDLLIIPHLPDADQNSWSRVIELRQADLPEFDASIFPETTAARVPPRANPQTEPVFAEEARRVRAAAPPLAWRRPSDHDSDKATLVLPIVNSAEQPDPELVVPGGAGALRGTILHKLMEEYLTGELPAEETAGGMRARELLAQLAHGSETEARPNPDEMAATSLRTLSLPEIAAMRPNLVAEYAVWSADGDSLLSGRGDALAIIGGVISIVLDWKSDIAPGSSARARHAGQVRDYMRATGAARGAVVYMTSGAVVWVELAPG